MDTCFIILAAGQSKRMNSSLPKALHEINGKAMLGMIIDKIKSKDVPESSIFVVVHHKKEDIVAYLGSKGYSVNIVEQHSPIGTADAVKSALPQIGYFERAAVLCTDVPLVDIDKVLEMGSSDCDLCLLTAHIDEPSGYGRIVRDDQQNISRIVEQKDIDDEEIEQITEINTGILVSSVDLLEELLPLIRDDNAQKEYYLTDLVWLANAHSYRVENILAGSIETFLGVNNQFQLSYLERLHKQRLIVELMKKGIRFIAPETTEIWADVEVNGRDVIIEPNVILKGRVKFGDNVRVCSFSYLENVEISDNVIIYGFSHLKDTIISSNVNVGPYACLEKSTFADSSRAGTFVQVRRSSVGEDSKVPHLSYVGDAQIGKGVNIGAGVIVCNYDGKFKHETKIGDNTFIGSNSSLVAPVEIGSGVLIGADSFINKDVEADTIAFNKKEIIKKKRNK